MESAQATGPDFDTLIFFTPNGEWVSQYPTETVSSTTYTRRRCGGRIFIRYSFWNNLLDRFSLSPPANQHRLCAIMFFLACSSTTSSFSHFVLLYCLHNTVYDNYNKHQTYSSTAATRPTIDSPLSHTEAFFILLPRDDRNRIPTFSHSCAIPPCLLAYTTKSPKLFRLNIHEIGMW